MIEGARNDYDLRRTIEAAAMSGKKKAIKLQKKGFKDVGDVRKWQNFSEKAAKRHGQGGDFSSDSDYMGLTKSMVIRDRNKQDEGYRREFASIKDMNALRDDLEAQEEASNHQTQPLEKSDALARAEDRLTEAEQNLAESTDRTTTLPLLIILLLMHQNLSSMTIERKLKRSMGLSPTLNVK